MPEMEWTAEAVVALREALRMSRIELARKLGVTTRTVASWESGRTATLRAASRRLLYDVLAQFDADQQERFRAVLEPGEGSASLLGTDVVERDPRSAGSRAVSLGGLPFDIVERREFVRLLGVLSAQFSMTDDMDWDSRNVVGPYVTVDDELIDSIESTLSAAMAQDDRFGPWLVLQSVVTQQNLVASLLPDCPNRLRSRLLSVYANLTRFAGWLYFDMGDWNSAGKFYERARLAAHEAQDLELAAFTLSHMSHLALWQKKPRLAVDHAAAALSWARQANDPLLVADAAEMAARGYAEIGEKTACLTVLDVNMEATSGTVGSRRPSESLAYFYGPGLSFAVRSHCLRRIGDAGGAEAAARESLRSIDPSFVRDRAFSVLDLGNAYLEQQDIEAASAAYGDAADFAKQNHSGRLIDALRTARSELDPWRDSITVRELDDKLAAHGFLTGNSST